MGAMTRAKRVREVEKYVESPGLDVHLVVRPKLHRPRSADPYRRLRNT